MKFWIHLLFIIATAPITAQISGINYLTHNVVGSHLSTDLDNDGDLDIIAETDIYQLPAHRALVWYENEDGMGASWTTHSINLPDVIPTISAIAAVDITGDGWKDIVLSQPFTLVHNGDGSDVAFTIVSNNTNNQKQFQLGDIDNDGDPDLIKWGLDGFRCFLNLNQDGTFGNPVTIEAYDPNIDELPYGGHLADIDQDGDLDLIGISLSNQTELYYVVFYDNVDGLGNFIPSQVLYSGSNYDVFPQFIIQTGDFNGDNLTDIIYSRTHRIELLFQQAGNNWSYQGIPTNSILGLDIQVADFDNDGDLDLIEGLNINDFNQTFSWYENLDSSEVFTPHNASAPMGVMDDFQFSIGDFNLDGDTDISFMAINGSGEAKNGIFLLENDLNNSGVFNQLRQVSDNINGYLKPFSFDPDNDQDQDLLIYSSQDRDFHWIENLNISDSFSVPALLISNTTIKYPVLQDLDHDGKADIIAVTDNKELVWYKNISAITAQFEAQEVILNEIHQTPFVAGDFDNDGDIDLAAIQANTFAVHWYEQTSPGNFVDHFVADGSSSFEIVGFADLDNNSHTDIIFKDESSPVSQLKYFNQAPDGSFSSVFVDEGEIRQIEITDIDNDLDDDLIIRVWESPNLVYKLIKNEAGNLSIHELAAVPSSSSREFIVTDLDQDGKKDIYTGNAWFKQLNEPDNFSGSLPLHQYGTGHLLTTDLSDDGIADLVFSSIGPDALLWMENQLSEASWVEGRVAIDQDNNCELSALDTMGLYGWIIEFEKDSVSYFTSTNPNGYYAALLPDSGDYNVSISTPNNYWFACVSDTLLTGVNPDSISLLDFPIQIDHECPLMQIDMSSGNLRPCMEGTLSIQYCNEGTLLAEAATVEVVLDHFLNFNSANFPYEETDTSLIFALGNIDFLDCGTIQLSVTPDCDSIEVGDVVCSTAYVSPDSLCTGLDSLWDGSTIQVSGFCLDDSIHFELRNIGTGAMEEARQFRIEIVNDDIVLLIEADTFLLEPDESKTIVIDSEMEIMRIEADQDENHPVLATASTIVSECADFDFMLNLLPQNDGDPFSETYCREITGSYDPNLKAAIPAGIGPQALIDRDWELEYSILFQNTGNDTAFNVVIRDVLSDFLDLTTLRIGAASHPFTWELNTERELAFTFENILLPDSTTNEPASNGYVQFFIKPLADIPSGSVIQNKAAIYFDFNAPIITNLTSRTIRTPVLATSSHAYICVEDYFQGVQIFGDTLMVDSTLTNTGLSLNFNHIHVFSNPVVSIDTMIASGDFIHGIQIYQDTVIEIMDLSVNGCDSLTIYNLYLTTNTDEAAGRNDLVVFPIPATHEVFVQWNSKLPPPSVISVLTSHGQLLQSNTLETNTETFNLQLSGFPRGVYWLKVDFRDKCIYRRVIKI